ncbi:MAG: response regulator transcription factor [Anaerolineae bacterium]|nr:response regulator transcription factor [Anaerolineae bacterium]
MADLIRVLLADDHPVMRSGISHLLEMEPDITVVGEVGDRQILEEVCLDVRPDVILLDLLMPGPPALQVIRQLRARCPTVRLLIFSGYENYIDVQDLVRAGVSGFVHKDERPQMVVQAVRTAYSGGTVFSGPVARRLHGVPAHDPLTERERQVLQHLARGLTNDGIAMQLSVTERTVRYHLGNIYNKLGVGSRAEAIAWAVRHGLDEQGFADLSDPTG